MCTRIFYCLRCSKLFVVSQTFLNIFLPHVYLTPPLGMILFKLCQDLVSLCYCMALFSSFDGMLACDGWRERRIQDCSIYHASKQGMGKNDDSWCASVQVEVKPYVLDDQLCDECQGARCGGKFAPFFCASVTCLQYYCEQCWMQIHSRPGREYHKPLVKEGADRPRSLPFRWCWGRLLITPSIPFVLRFIDICHFSGFSGLFIFLS